MAGVLAVFAHPDDESLLAGGTLAACAAAGRRGGRVDDARRARAGHLGSLRSAKPSCRRQHAHSASPLRNASAIPTASWAASMRTKPRRRWRGCWSASSRRR